MCNFNLVYRTNFISNKANVGLCLTVSDITPLFPFWFTTYHINFPINHYYGGPGK